MNALNVMYNQTITLFNRLPSKNGEPMMWIPTVIDGVHLIVNRSSNWNSHGGKSSNDVKLHIPYTWRGDDAMVSCRVGTDETAIVQKKWFKPKAWRKELEPESGITFAFGDNDDFDFFIEGVFDEFQSPISDRNFERKGFYGYMNANYDDVFVISSVQKFSLIPHFELTAR